MRALKKRKCLIKSFAPKFTISRLRTVRPVEEKGLESTGLQTTTFLKIIAK